jgi:hypothetical protein
LSFVQTLTELNDFITPSQACIKPVEHVETPHQEPFIASVSCRAVGKYIVTVLTSRQTEIRVDSQGQYYEEENVSTSVGRPTRRLKPAQISLNDCLACKYIFHSFQGVHLSL